MRPDLDAIMVRWLYPGIMRPTNAERLLHACADIPALLEYVEELEKRATLALSELGEPTAGYPVPVANAVQMLRGEWRGADEQPAECAESSRSDCGVRERKRTR